MVRRGPRQRVGSAGQNLVADGGQPFPKDLANVWMPARPADDPGHRVLMNIAGGELVQVGRETAAWLHLPARVDDQRLARAFAVIFDKPGPVPAAGHAFGA